MSMARNMGIAKELGYLKLDDDDDIIDIGAAEMMAPERVVIVTTGTQGETMADCRGCRVVSIAV